MNPATDQAFGVSYIDPDVPLIAELTGNWYHDCLTDLHAALRPRSYLEIGTREGDTLRLARCPSIAIDPQFMIEGPVIGQGVDALMLFQITSDEFFAKYNPRALLGMPIDFAFIDGLHLIENVLSDFINVEAQCHAASVIAIHDCVPLDPYMATRDQYNRPLRDRSPHPKWWTGDVWKLLPILSQHRPDLTVSVFDSDPTGLVIVQNLDPSSTVLAERREAILREFLAPELEASRFAAFIASLQLMPTAELLSRVMRGRQVAG